MSSPADNISSEFTKDEFVLTTDEFTPTHIPANTPNAVDAYISLVDSWKDADRVDVITITPESTIADIGSGIRAGSSYSRADSPPVTEFYDKVDAIYDKVSSLETTNFDALNTICQINGQLDNVCRNSVGSAKNIRTIDSKVDKLSAEVTSLNLRFEIISAEIRAIKDMLTQVVRKEPVNAYSSLNFGYK